ncbi:helix-turn-helix transcriptional regulator [Desulfosporosinus sp. OT]|uniref:helix-turn-helix domain-containing protein n=1 Tax=Desulfosporosinus sp. OT TaxID=913865 RepID=UPI000223A4D9|nr:helix-turn-helix transcriptional regulator [Desulfosporosinus sp. OT]EGW37075.1 helix-turn-helix family protein [Desulfosporosinus sp. OT]
MSIGKVLTKLRTQKGMSQYDVADKLGIQRSRYNAWENERAEPKLDMINTLADFFGVTPDYLLQYKTKSDTPSWATAKDKRDFKKMLEEDDDLMFDGVPIEGDDRQRIKDVLTGLFWEAKQMNKRKKKPDSTNDTKK